MNWLIYAGVFPVWLAFTGFFMKCIFGDKVKDNEFILVTFWLIPAISSWIWMCMKIEGGGCG